MEAFYYKTFRGVVTGEAAGHGDTECDTGAGAGERHTLYQNQEAKPVPSVPSTGKA